MALASGVYSLIGVGVGAIATGGFQYLLARRSEGRDSQAAARLVAVELRSVIAMIDGLIEHPTAMPTEPELRRLLETPMWARYQDTLARRRRLPWGQLAGVFTFMPELARELAVPATEVNNPYDRAVIMFEVRDDASWSMVALEASHFAYYTRVMWQLRTELKERDKRIEEREVERERERREIEARRTGGSDNVPPPETESLAAHRHTRLDDRFRS